MNKTDKNQPPSNARAIPMYEALRADERGQKELDLLRAIANQTETVRGLQISFFATRNGDVLKRSKAEEKILDKLLRDLKLLKISKQGDLFQ